MSAATGMQPAAIDPTWWSNAVTAMQDAGGAVLEFCKKVLLPIIACVGAAFESLWGFAASSNIAGLVVGGIAGIAITLVVFGVLALIARQADGSQTAPPNYNQQA